MISGGGRCQGREGEKFQERGREIFGGRERRKKREGEKGGKGGGEKGGDPGKKHRIFLIFEGAQERSTRYFGILGRFGRESRGGASPRAAEGRPKKSSMWWKQSDQLTDSWAEPEETIPDEGTTSDNEPNADIRPNRA